MSEQRTSDEQSIPTTISLTGITIPAESVVISGEAFDWMHEELHRLQQCHREGWLYAKEVEDEFEKRMGYRFGQEPA